MSNKSLSKISKVALQVMSQLIKSARIERGISQQDLADRLNVSRYTVIAIEKADPKVSVGTVFEAAYIVGVPLLAKDKHDLEKMSAQVSKFGSLLPKRSHKKSENFDDDF